MRGKEDTTYTVVDKSAQTFIEVSKHRIKENRPTLTPASGLEGRCSKSSWYAGAASSSLGVPIISVFTEMICLWSCFGYH